MISHAEAHSKAIMQEAIDRFGIEHVAVGFNGGKDCMVMLDLFISVINRHQSEISIPLVFVAPRNGFAVVDDFIQMISKRYSHIFRLFRYEGLGLKEAFSRFMHETDHRYQAILVGLRRADPHGPKASAFDPTTPDWPSFIRIHPMLEWRYGQIWEYIRDREIPYCRLYDQGYTSLGSHDDTLPNPSLYDGKVYLPAYQLPREEDERLGRL